MRSHSSSHRSSFSRSHRSGLSRSHSRMHRSSLSHNSMHRSSMHRTSSGRSSMHRSSMHKRSAGISSMHKSALRRHGISNAHAFAVGKATGININGSPMGAHGAALHRFRKMRTGSHFKRSTHSKRNTSSIFNRRSSLHNTYKSSSDFLKRMRVSHTKHRYTSKKADYTKIQDMGKEVNTAMNEFAKFAWIPFAIFFIIFLAMIAIFITIFFLVVMRNIVF